MRIDGRLDPKQWVQPQTEEAETSAPIAEQRHDRQTALAGIGQHEVESDFAAELQLGCSYTHASRTAATVAEMLETTPDL
jgi:hypothetical protein